MTERTIRRLKFFLNLAQKLIISTYSPTKSCLETLTLPAQTLTGFPPILVTRNHAAVQAICGI